MDVDVQPPVRDLPSTTAPQPTQSTAQNPPHPAHDVQMNESRREAPRRPLVEPEPYEHTLNVIYIFDSEDDPMAFSDTETAPRARSVQRYFGEPGCGPIEATPEPSTARPFGMRKSKRLRDKTAAPAPQAGMARAHPIIISSDSEEQTESATGGQTSDEEEPEDDGVVGPRRPLWVYKVKPPARSPQRPAEDPVEPADDEGSGLRPMTRKLRGLEPGGCSGLVQRKVARKRKQKPPRALEQRLRDLQEEFPDDDFSLGYRNLSDGVVKWGFRCQTCLLGAPLRRLSWHVCTYDLQLISGANTTVAASNMRQHLGSPRHRTETPNRAQGQFTNDDCAGLVQDPAPPPAATTAVEPAFPISSASTKTFVQSPEAAQNRERATTSAQPEPGPSSSQRPAGVSSRKDSMDDVERFLCSIMLAPTLASALRTLGITDRATMQSWAQVPDAMFDRLETRLEQAGLNMTQAMMVRFGLQRGAAGAKGDAR
ncbi:hypothetical protein C2E23DRAFT_818551 [Lenzites betulinus]|nr:hypothetical protein C2E23DRAFT_818551 [Lenzites betulinus]